MILRLAARALWERRQRAGLALAALTVAAALATSLVGLYADIERKLRGQFRGYGANLVVAPAGDRRTLPVDWVVAAESYGPAAPWLYWVETVEGEPVVLAGVDFRRVEPLAGYWQVSGRRRPVAGECLAGERVAERFRLRVGSRIGSWQVAGIVSTGGAEDSQILLPIEQVARRAGLAGAASLIAARVDGSQAERARWELAARLPQAEVRLLRAVVESEAAVVLKIRGTLLLLTLLTLVITGLCVMNNFGAIVHQRRKEIGILKAIGGADRRIAALLGVEVGALAVAGSLAGFGLGWWITRWLGWEIFRQPAPPPLESLPLVLAVTLLVALAGTAAPLLRLRSIEPAVTLRGE